MKFLASVRARAVAIALTTLVGVEGLSLISYQDTGGVWTICYGYTHGVTKNQKATKEQCWTMLETEADAVADAIEPMIRVPVNSNQLAALIDFCYNVGTYNCKTSTLFAKLNRGDYDGAGKEFVKWHYVKRKDCYVRANDCYGIINRRLAETALWRTPE